MLDARTASVLALLLLPAALAGQGGVQHGTSVPGPPPHEALVYAVRSTVDEVAWIRYEAASEGGLERFETVAWNADQEPLWRRTDLWQGGEAVASRLAWNGRLPWFPPDRPVWVPVIDYSIDTGGFPFGSVDERRSLEAWSFGAAVWPCPYVARHPENLAHCRHEAPSERPPDRGPGHAPEPAGGASDSTGGASGAPPDGVPPSWMTATRSFAWRGAQTMPPLEPASLPALPRHVVWQTADAAPWGPVEAGVELPFSPHDAYEAATSPTAPDRLLGRSDVASFLAEHPDAFPSTLQGTVGLSGERQRFTWRFLFSDGAHALDVQVRRSQEPPVGLRGLPPVTDDDVDAEPVEHAPTAGPRGALPTAASLVGAWSEATGRPAGQATTWGLQSGPDETVLWSGRAVYGLPSQRLTRVPAPDQSAHGLNHMLFWNDEGTLKGSVTETWAYEQGLHPLLGGPTRAQDARDGLLSWSSPAHGEALVAVGVMATLIGAATFLAPFFTRVRADRALLQPTRRGIHDLLVRHPGLNVREVARRLALGRGTVAHHVRVLQRLGLLRSRKAGREHRLYAGPVPSSGRLEQLVEAPHGRTILALVADGAGVMELRGRIPLSPSALHRRLASMESAGLVRRGTGRPRPVAVTEAGLQMLGARRTRAAGPGRRPPSDHDDGDRAPDRAIGSDSL